MFSTNLYLSLILSFFAAQSLSRPPVSDPPVSAAESEPVKVFNLGPRATSNQTFYLRHGFNFQKNSTIYDATGKAAYYVNILKPKSISLQMRKKPKSVTTIDLSNCTTSKHYPHYILNLKSHKWEIRDKTHQPGRFSGVYKRSPKGSGPAGLILLRNTKILASILVDQPPPPKIGGGKHYAVHIPVNKNEDAYIEPEDALTLLFLLLIQGKPCSSLKASSRIKPVL
ncbi:hypothetical protein CROQUDRAFT_665357 [Cronartium quercuum f. sp. fusiforme G11]|uniref:Uncharacterized protein n=1 Tax=Cronartium quercuum f. sp. fusiforme G11 TaxID=708437 RepID=A0A9P6T6E2_9BASI|nr:hypothetical protein CROQUDRAFT_665357 [Cronartium quercuum f. sp. fusiforme G11]